MLVDVRSMPYSQFTPQFNKETWVAILRQAGIAYTFAGEYLGGRPKDPVCYRNGVLPEGKADYLSLVDYARVEQQPWYQKGVRRLVAIASEQRTAIMCSEEDPQECHRHHLIAQTLIGMGIPVYHLRHTGQVVQAHRETRAEQLSLFGTE